MKIQNASKTLAYKKTWRSPVRRRFTDWRTRRVQDDRRWVV